MLGYICERCYQKKFEGLHQEGNQNPEIQEQAKEGPAQPIRRLDGYLEN